MENKWQKLFKVLMIFIISAATLICYQIMGISLHPQDVYLAGIYWMVIYMYFEKKE